MAEGLTPRQMAKGLLKGIAPPRPLFVPIVFSLGAKLENVPLRTFLTNPTKISNSLRQIWSHLRSDGGACYFDPLLEAEAAGGVLEWTIDGQQPIVRWPEAVGNGRLPEGLRSPEEVAKSGRVAVAVEVIRRLSSLLRDGSLLAANVSGPCTLAARLVQSEPEHTASFESLPGNALEFASSVSAQIAGALGKAGAHMIFIREEVLPPLTSASCDVWASLLAPTVNVIRFYEAVPVLQLTNSRSFAGNAEFFLGRQWDCVVCPTLDGLVSLGSQRASALSGTKLGAAAPSEAFGSAEGSSELHQSLLRMISELQPAILTTTGDVPAEADLGLLTKFVEGVRRPTQAGC